MASADAAAAGAGQASNNDILAALNSINSGLAAVRAKQDEQEVALTDLRSQASLTAAATTGLSARLTAVESGTVAKPADTKDEDPEEALDYVPYFDGREENPYPLRPRGVTDRPQLYPLGHGDPVYDHLRKKQNAAYHELGTLEPALSYFWDSNFFFDDWAARENRIKKPHTGAVQGGQAAVGGAVVKDLWLR
eukprot:SAG31_NODE_2289_length_6000_cov_3.020336_1_plen_193_part_00